MADRHVHWWDEVVTNDDSDAFFVPPPPNQSPFSTTNPDDNSSLADSPSPQTPPTVLAPVSSSPHVYQPRYRGGGMPLWIQVPVFADARIRSPDGPPWRHGEPSPRSDRYNMMAIGSSLPPSSPLRPSPPKLESPRLPGQSRRGSISNPDLHPVLTAPSTSIRALFWKVDDEPSYDTVLMNKPKDRRTLIPVPANILNEPATNPPRQEMRIHCVSNSLWEPLVIRAADIRSPGAGDSRGQSPANAVQFIAIKHVIRRIFDYLHTPMSPEEYDALDKLPIPGLQKDVARSFHQRRDTEERRIEEQQRSLSGRRIDNSITPSRRNSDVNISARTAQRGGLRRYDCLLGQTHFLGLRSVAGSPSEWYIVVEAPPS